MDGDRRIGCVSKRAASMTAFKFSGVETSGGGGAFLRHHADTDARERYAAHRHKVAGSAVIVHCRHREGDGVVRLLRELLVGVKRRSASKGHLMAGLLLKFSGDGLRRSDTEDAHLGRTSKGRSDDRRERTDGYSAKRQVHDFLKNAAVVIARVD
jgi:hypothetical protein